MSRLLVCAQRPWILVWFVFLLLQCTDNDGAEMEEAVTSMDADPITETSDDFDPLPELTENDEVLDDMVDSTEPEFQMEETEPFQGATPVYFGFDQAMITPDAEVQLARLAMYLKENLDQNLKIEGHCDERGTVEYNLALGEKRALSVMNFLVNLGVDASRITTTSMGEEMPAVAGSDAYSWSQNRRVEFILGFGF